jgi:catechol 2,3-dioxygenase-like lactoylglutathione lyase family enzyme
VLDDLAAATEFFVELGLVLHGEGQVEGRWVDRVVALEGVRVDFVMMQTPDGNGRLELVKFHSPSTRATTGPRLANTPAIRHVAFAVEDIDAVVAGLRARGAELRLRRALEGGPIARPTVRGEHSRLRSTRTRATRRILMRCHRARSEAVTGSRARRHSSWMSSSSVR